MTTLSADYLLPCLLRLTAHSVTFLLHSGTECDLVHAFSNSVFRYLQADRILLPSAVLRSQGDTQQSTGVPVYTLTDSCLLRIISTSSSTSPWMTEVSPTTAYRLLSAYLDMSLGLLSAEKAAFFAGMDSWFTETLEEGALVGDNHSPLLACLVFCYDLLVEVGGGDSRRSIIPKLLVGSPDAKSGILHLGKLFDFSSNECWRILVTIVILQVHWALSDLEYPSFLTILTKSCYFSNLLLPLHGYL